MWGGFQMETDQIGAHKYFVARQLNLNDVLNTVRGKEIMDLTYLSWPAGCQVLTPWFIRFLLKLVVRGRAMKRMFRRH